MIQLLTVVALGAATALATGLGAIPVFYLGRGASNWEPALWGLAAGVMTVASIVGLLLPATDEGTTAEVAVGLGIGVAFLTIARLALRGRDIHVGTMSGAGVRLSVLVFFVLFVHSLPEGFAIGTAYASDTAGLSSASSSSWRSPCRTFRKARASPSRWRTPDSAGRSSSGQRC